jgi:beta-aspartyl-peptidase (threonine type)
MNEAIKDLGGGGRLVMESGVLPGPVVAVHGGAGTFRVLREGGAQAKAALEAGLEVALGSGWAVLSAGGAALEAAVEAVAAMEDSGLFNAGRGSVPTTAGTVETDAAVMDGATGRAGGVCALTWPANPVRAALAVTRLSGDPVPLLLAGAGGDQLAKAQGLAPMPARTGGAEASTASTRGTGAGGRIAGSGTVGAVAIDAAGHLAAATSTGGLAGQRPGRVGDSAIPGAGTWADDATAAISATGTGEAIVLAGLAHLVDRSLRDGASLDVAVARALGAVLQRGGTGGAIALSARSEVAFAFSTPAMARGWRAGDRFSIKI